VTNIHLEKPRQRHANKLLNQALCFGNFLILVRDCGRQVESWGGMVPACEAHLSPSERQGS